MIEYILYQLLIFYPKNSLIINAYNIIIYLLMFNLDDFFGEFSFDYINYNKGLEVFVR